MSALKPEYGSFILAYYDYASKLETRGQLFFPIY